MNLFWWARHLFVPHHSNNCKAKILHPSALAVLVGFFLFYQCVFNFYLLVSPSVLGFASNSTPEKVVEMTNQKRAEQGLSPLTINGQLNEAAQRKAGDMFSFNYWSHVSPSGRNPWAFFQEVGYRYLYAGENLARDFMDSQAVVEAWMNSATHRDNVLNKNYQEIGLAVVNGTLNGVETTLVVQMFGTPLSSTPVAQRPSTVKAPSPTPIPTATVSPAPVQPVVSEVAEKTPEVVEIKEEVEETGPLSRNALAPAQEQNQSPPLLSPFMLTKTLAIFLLGLILGALLLDIILVYQKRIIRLSGRNVAHLIFI